MKTILIYRQALLPISETFIQAQAAALRSFQPKFVGLLPASHSLPLAPDATLLSSSRSLLSHGRTALYRSAGFAPRFHQRVRLARPCLIHAHFAPDGAAALPLADALRVPLIVTLHGYDVTERDRYMRKTLAGKLYLRRRARLWERASLFICVSEFIREQALRAGFPKEKLRVHYIGINRQVFYPAPAPAEKMVLFVGRLVTKKGCIHLLRAMRRVQDAEPDAQLIVVGDGPLRESLQKSANELRLRCEFVGSQPGSAVLGWIRRASLLCIPSITAPDGGSEGLGMVILEAQASGRPVVGFHSGGIPEAVKHGVTGLLAANEDEAELSRHILRYLQDKAFWQRCSAAGINWTAERFDLDRQTRELEGIYEECLGWPALAGEAVPALSEMAV
jgi:colanic acid/amylovoran biosynthesis glycosyltransferase